MIAIKLIVYSVFIFFGNVLLMAICGTCNHTNYSESNNEAKALYAYALFTIIIEIVILWIISK